MAHRVILVSWHCLNSKRRAGFHFLADAFHHAGREVVFITVALSRLSRLRGDPRLAYLTDDPPNHLRRIRDGLTSFVWYTTWHPANLRLAILNSLSRPIFVRYGELPLGDVEPMITEADLIIFESSPGLMLFDRFKRLAPGARFVYRVSDDLRLLKNHPLVIETEQRVAPRFDLISSPSAGIHRRFAHLPTARLQHHGVDKRMFDADHSNPYGDPARKHLVFTGNAHFDHDFLHRAARLFPDWAFHIIGPITDLPILPNVHATGEIPFERTIPFIRHADIGLHTLDWSPGAESFTDSLKVLQYTHCRLPIVAPEFLGCDRANLCYYRPGDDESIRAALAGAAAMDRASIPAHTIRTWDELAAELAGESDQPALSDFASTNRPSP